MDDLSNSEVIEPISASADGKRNSYSFACAPMAQSMNYAACIWRQSVLSAKNVKTPADWSGCAAAANNGSCTALQMRKEEELAGKAIYFRDRGVVRKIVDTFAKWVTPSAPTPRPAAAPVPKPSSMLDAMGSAGSFADAVTAVAKTPTVSPPVTLVPTSAPKPADTLRPVLFAALPGETPLQMARRITAARSQPTGV